ncbi:MAG: phosphodiester glycosidase family protein, partial [Bacteroidota bacterium]
ELIFAMNAGMFEPDRRAKGLLIVGGKRQQVLDTLRQGYGNFYMQPNGVFAIDTSGKAYVLTTQTYLRLADTLALNWATQSGPMMVVEGRINPLFNDGSPNRHIRNAVGVTANNELVFAMSAQRVTFYELSSFMINQGCENVLYLDGAISQAYLPTLGLDRLEAGDRLGPIIAITHKMSSP